MRTVQGLRSEVRGLGIALTAALLLLAGAAFAQEGPPPAEGAASGAVEPAPAQAPAADAVAVAGEDEQPTIEWHLNLDNLFIFRNDRDFDRTPPAYDENGQTEGAFATVFRPSITWNLQKDLKVFYEIEVGLNYWSKNNPDEENALAADIFVLKHRQLYTEGTVADGHLGFKVGYQYFTDTTGLFLGHWIGAANFSWEFNPQARVTLFAGQIPDTTYEGMDIRFNNFRRDIWVFGARTDLSCHGFKLAFGIHNLYDSHIVGKTRWVIAPNVQLSWKGENAEASLGAVLQGGKSYSTALDGGDQTILAWAAQGHAAATFKPVTLSFNVLALSPDDKYDGNDRNGAFLYSSKSTSSTVYITEDEVRNWYDQLDRRLARYEGGFWQHRAGLFVGDVKATFDVAPWFRPSVILGASSVLNPDNAMGHAFIGFEGDLDLAFRYGEHLVARVMPGIFVPGKAAAAIINEGTDREATGLIYSCEAAISVVY